MNRKKLTIVLITILMSTATIKLQAVWGNMIVEPAQKRQTLLLNVGDFSASFGSGIPMYEIGKTYSKGSIVTDGNYYFLLKKDIKSSDYYALHWSHHDVFTTLNTDKSTWTSDWANYPKEGLMVIAHIVYDFKNGTSKWQESVHRLSFDKNKNVEYNKVKNINDLSSNRGSIVHYEGVIYIANVEYKKGHIPGVDRGWTPMNHKDYIPGAYYTKKLQGEVVSVIYDGDVYTLVGQTNKKNNKIIGPGEDESVWKLI